MICMKHRILIVPENKSLCMPVSFQMELTRRKNSWNVYLVLPRLLTITIDAVVGVVLDELAETLAEGYIVELGELGHFSISLKCTHKVMTKREIRAESICFDNVHLRTSKEFKRKIKREIELERVDKSKHSSQKVEFSMEQRQQLLQEFLRKNGGITRLEYSSLTGLSRLKAIDDLNTFIEKGILRKRGAGRTVFYVWQQE